MFSFLIIHYPTFNSKSQLNTMQKKVAKKAGNTGIALTGKASFRYS